MKRNGEAGQTLVFVALGMVLLGAALGLALDLGYMRLSKRRIQTAVDSAAIAGAAEINYADVTAAAKADAASNGFTDGVNGVTVTVNSPPASGPKSGKTGLCGGVDFENRTHIFHPHCPQRCHHLNRAGESRGVPWEREGLRLHARTFAGSHNDGYSGPARR